MAGIPVKIVTSGGIPVTHDSTAVQAEVTESTGLPITSTERGVPMNLSVTIRGLTPDRYTEDGYVDPGYYSEA